MRKLSLFVLALVFSVTCMAKGSINILVNLSPAGSFSITSDKVKGSVKKSGDTFTTDKLYVKTKYLKTGLELRDNHMQKKLEKDKYPKIEILKGKARGGKGVAIIQIKDIKKKIGFTYQEAEDKLKVKFPLSLKDFNFSGINYAGVGVKDRIVVEAEVPVK